MRVDYKEIGEKVKLYREIRGFTQEQLAEKADFTAKHISGIENFRTKMSLDCCIRISKALDITPNHLLSDELDHKQKSLDMEFAEMLHQCSVQEQKKFMKYLHAFIEIERG